MQHTHPRQWDYCINKLGIGEFLDYLNIPYKEVNQLLDNYEVYVYDCEVFHSDWLFVFKNRATGEYVSFWNMPDQLAEFMEAREDALFVGYNSSHYDQYILKAILAGCDPEQVKEVNDWIVGTDNQPWEQPYLKGFYYDFSDIDLMKDVQMGTSLKSIEGHAGMSVEESDVPFDIDRALTDDEREEVEEYCRHDVDATAQLLEMRMDYLMTKAKLGERAGLEVPRAMALTNAKLTAAVLGAERQEWDDEREYRYPDNLLREFIPPEVFAFFDRMADESVPDEELWSSKLEIEVGGCPVTLGFGGIHGALPKWKGETDSKMQLVNADVASYYPSLMIYNGYTSRNMPHPDVFKGIYEERLEAKRNGDKATANALKLIVNTTYGATLNQYNDLYDPLQARSVCVSGQLYLLELACHLVRDVEGLVLVQLNTDGILVMAPKGSATDKTFMAIVNEWQERTHFALEFDKIQRIWQKDVNNYAMRLQDGHEKFKGGYLVRGASTVGAFSINENATIVAEALRLYLLDGKPVAETIEACDDPRKFQLIAKAGHKYRCVYQKVWAIPDLEIHDDPDWKKVPVQKCNRVFATIDETLGRLYKVKAADGRVAKVESLPDHCLISNGGYPPIEDIDKQWYIALAEKRAQDFESEKSMAEETTTETAAKPAAKRGTTKKAAATDYSKMNVYQKLAIARKMFLDEAPKKSGTNDHSEYDYFELEDIVPAQTRIFAELGLVEIFHYEPSSEVTVSNSVTDDTKTYKTEALAQAFVVNCDNPDEQVDFQLTWGEVEAIISKKTGKRVNQPIQDKGGEQTFMRRYLKMQVLDIVEYDPTDATSREEVEKPAGEPKVKVPSASKPAAKKPATAAERKTAAKAVTNADGAATNLQLRQLKTAMKKLKDEHGEEHPEVGQFVAELSASTDKLKHSADDEGKPFSKAECEAAIQKLGEMREQFETEGSED